MIPTPEQVQAAIDKAEKADGLSRPSFGPTSTGSRCGGASDVRKRWVVGVLAFVLGAYSARGALSWLVRSELGRLSYRRGSKAVTTLPGQGSPWGSTHGGLRKTESLTIASMGALVIFVGSGGGRRPTSRRTSRPRLRAQGDITTRWARNRCRWPGQRERADGDGEPGRPRPRPPQPGPVLRGPETGVEVTIKPYYQPDRVTLYHGDCREVMASLDAVDAVVTDPPYGLSFMGKALGLRRAGRGGMGGVPRALKPGGHLLAFAGTRTQHRMAVNIEDAGFDIRDMIAWVYGSGFPSHNRRDWKGGQGDRQADQAWRARLDSTVGSEWGTARSTSMGVGWATKKPRGLTNGPAEVGNGKRYRIAVRNGPLAEPDPSGAMGNRAGGQLRNGRRAADRDERKLAPDREAPGPDASHSSRRRAVARSTRSAWMVARLRCFFRFIGIERERSLKRDGRIGAGLHEGRAR